MNKITISIICFISSMMSLWGIERYDASQIPADLLANANAVMRTHQRVCEYQNLSSCVTRVKTAITILNQKALEWANVKIYYNSGFESIKNLTIRYYDEKGKLYRTVRKNSVVDYGLAGSESYNDFRVIAFWTIALKYPFTVEYEYELRSSLIFGNSGTTFQSDPQVSVEQAYFQAIFPKDFPFRYYQKNFKQKPDSTVIGNRWVYTWVAENLPAYESYRPFSIPFEELAPSVFVTPIHFKVDKYQGDFTSWESFGKWIYRLIEGRDELQPEQQEKIRKMVEDIADERKKVSVLYRYFQSHTRYLGNYNKVIEGWQPHPAYEVAKTGYGDCKDLTNYMKAILKAAGISAYYTVIGAGDDREVLTNFPSNQFNHIILCVPLKNDTMWLECTSQTSPPGHLGFFTDDRYALLVTENGGKLIHTPRYTINENKISLKATVDISINGNATANITLSYAGPQYDKVSDINELTFNQKNNVLKYYLNIPDFSIQSLSYTEQTDQKIPIATLTTKLDLYNVATINSHQIIFCPGLSNRWPYVTDNQVTLYLSHDRMFGDTVVYTFPSGYRPIFIPKPQKIMTPYGSYEYKIECADNKIFCYRTLILYKGRYEDNEHVVGATKFFNMIARQERVNVILSNN